MSETKTALDEIKGIESQARKMQLIEILSDLKKKAKEIKKAKHYTDSILKEMGYDSKEVKSIIDYINSQATIDEKDIEEDVRDELEQKKYKVVEKMKNNPNLFYGSNNLVATTTSTPYFGSITGTGGYSSTYATNAVCTTGTTLCNASSPTIADLELIDSL